ncbi:MAG: chemotaxis protein methyltransferase CheR [Labilithrix sp.]|nr:chemotaxis protein methyltransferase CheR [Labilithrix sp.]
MLLSDAGLLDRTELVATDVSSKSIARARAGALPPRSLRALSPNATIAVPSSIRRLAERWLTPTADGAAKVHRALVDAIDVRRDNILTPSIAGLESLDLIVCRNVLIYFRDDVVRSVVAMFGERLRPGGRLLVGASESLLRFGTLLRCEERAGAFFYVKDSK